MIHQRDGDTHIDKLAWQYVAALNLNCTWKIAGARFNAQIDLLLTIDDCMVIRHAYCRQARNRLGTPVRVMSFPKEAQIFWNMSNIFKLWPTHFSRGSEKFSRGFSPLVTGLHADTLICLQWYALVLTLRLFYVFGKNKITFGQKFFASPKTDTLVHLGQPGPGLHECWPEKPTDRRVLGKFLLSQHQLSLITPPRLNIPAYTYRVKCWNFRKAEWKRFCFLTRRIR